MIVVRQVFQATFGQGGALAAAMAEGIAQMMPGMTTPRRWRVLTDRSGPFNSVGQTAAPMASGRNEFSTLEAQG